MASYEKIYNLKSKYQLPAYIFLDKGNSYQFSLKMRSKEGLWADPEWERSACFWKEEAGTQTPSKGWDLNPPSASPRLCLPGAAQAGSGLCAG